MQDKVTIRHRIGAGAVFIAVLALFCLLWAAAKSWIDIGRLTGTEICGFKQATGLPCPGCGVTTSAMAFVKGRIFESFYIQPAGALLCCGLAAVAVLALLIAAFRVDFRFLHQPMSISTFIRIIVLLAIIFIAGWAVLLARAI